MDDQESLFGSPPPSPTIGRSPSFELALPASTAGYGTSLISQNVGTIALPGSQQCSELPINPLALSLSYAPRPPTPIQDQAQAVSRRHSTSSTPSTSRASSTTPRRRKRKESATRPPPPAIPMPDPTQPIPPNFLRSQTALLGTAGLVSGLNPASFKVQQTRGNSARNPIVIREDHRPPTQQKSSIAEHLSALNLPTPTTREIVYALIKEKNIFPVLANILKLVGRGAFKPSSSRSSTQEPQSEDQRPSKRRKLRTVPAGAADWDTPFPFKEGEGPEQYRANWERERGKQLISELVSIIKTATCKAAAKSFVQKEPEVLSHLSAKGAYLQSSELTAHSPPSTPSGSTILKDSSINNSPVTQDTEQPNDLNDLLTSLLTAQSEVPKSYGEEQTSSALFDSWMSIFQAFPQPSTPDDPFAFLSASVLPFQNTSGLEQGDIENPIQPLDPALEPPSTFTDGSFFMDQSGVDPSLLALSIPTFSESSSAWSSYPSSSMASPLHDTFGELGAFTPTSSVWTGDNASGLDPSTSQTALPSDNPAFFNDLPGQIAVKPSAAPPLNKEEVIKLAIQRRKQLAEDLVKARTQLWETTIEQGVLAHLVKTIR